MAGTDALVNHTYNSLAQGVSQQAVEARHETQVESLENCIPHVSRGVLRRNPVEFTATLRDKDNNILSLSDYFVYSYDRGTAGEQYIFLVGHYKWYVFNIEGILKGSYNDTTNGGTSVAYLNTNGVHPKQAFSLVTVGDHTWLSNNQITTQMLTGTDGLAADFHKSIAIYTVKSTSNIVTKTVNVTSGDVATSTPTLEGYKYNFKAHYNDNSYAATVDIAAVQGGSTYKTGQDIALAIRNLMNTGHVSGSTSAAIHGPYYSIKTTYYGYGGVLVYPKYSVLFRKSDSRYLFYWNGVQIGTSTTTTLAVGAYTYKRASTTLKYETEYMRYYTILRETEDIPAGDPLIGYWQQSGPTIYRRAMPKGATLEYSDSFGNTASYAFNGVVPSSDKLPETLPRGVGDVLVKVDASEDAEGGEYWLQWNGETWTEDRAPGLRNTLDYTTLPHTFLRAEDGTFSFGYYGQFDGSVTSGVHSKPNSPKWEDRLKGDETSAPTPSFVGKKINNMFIHNNRLGFLAEDAVVLSELAAYGNFFPTTVRTIPATDPIDIVVATTDVQGLKKALSLSGVLLLFSDQAQFALTGGGGALTPETAIVNAVSNYNYSDSAPATVIGNKIMFMTESGNGTQLFGMATEAVVGGSSNVTADNFSLHIPTYLPKNIRYMVSHSILGYLFMLSPDEPNTIYVLNTLEVNKQTAQTAFHKWTFANDVLGMSIIDNTLSLVMNNGSGGIMTSLIQLDVPVNTDAVVYKDELALGVYTNYTSDIILSKWFIKDPNGFGNKRGRLQIRTALFSTGYLDRYKVEILNDAITNPIPSEEAWVVTNAVWDDTAYWGYSDTDDDDTKVIWKDGLPFYSRIYYNDNKITVMSNSATTFIKFSNSDLEPEKGFTLSTVNLEGLFRQRSQRI